MWTDCERVIRRGEVIPKTKHGEQCETETVAFDNEEGNTEFKLSDGIVDEDIRLKRKFTDGMSRTD